MFEEIYKRSLQLDETILRKLQCLLTDRDYDEIFPGVPVASTESLSLPEMDEDYPQLTISRLREEWLSMKSLLHLANLDRISLRNENFSLLKRISEDQDLKFREFKIRSSILPYELLKKLLERERSKNEVRLYEEESCPVTKRYSADCSPHEEFLTSEFFTENEFSNSKNRFSYESRPQHSSTNSSPELTNKFDICSPVSCCDSSLDEANVEYTELYHNLPKVRDQFKAKFANVNASVAETPHVFVSTQIPDNLMGYLRDY